MPVHHSVHLLDLDIAHPSDNSLDYIRAVVDDAHGPGSSRMGQVHFHTAMQDTMAATWTEDGRHISALTKGFDGQLEGGMLTARRCCQALLVKDIAGCTKF